MAIIIAKLFRKFVFKEKDIPFVMELPPYRMPTLTSTLRHMWNKGGQYLKKVGGIIMIASIIIWFLQNYPKNEDIISHFDTQIEQVDNQKANLESTYQIDSASTVLINTYNFRLKQLELEKAAELQKQSYIGKIGRFIEPAIKPLGFDWKMGVSLLSGLAAKEVVVSTMAVIYHQDPEGKLDTQSSLKENIISSTNENGKHSFTPVVALSFLVFILIYFPCIGVIATIKKETGSWKWAIFTIVYTTGLAWVLSFIVYRVGNLIF